MSCSHKIPFVKILIEINNLLNHLKFSYWIFFLLQRRRNCACCYHLAMDCGVGDFSSCRNNVYRSWWTSNCWPLHGLLDHLDCPCYLTSILLAGRLSIQKIVGTKRIGESYCRSSNSNVSMNTDSLTSTSLVTKTHLPQIEANPAFI